MISVSLGLTCLCGHRLERDGTRCRKIKRQHTMPSLINEEKESTTMTTTGFPFVLEEAFHLD